MLGSDLHIRPPAQLWESKAFDNLIFPYNLSAKNYTLQKEMDGPCIYLDTI